MSKEQGFKYSFGHSTNKVEFLIFLETKIMPLIRYPRATLLVLDNHRAHHSGLVSEWLEEKGLNTLFLPPYSSELNPVEPVWALLKREWGNHLMRNDF